MLLTESRRGGRDRNRAPALVGALRRHRHELATLLHGNVATWEKFAPGVPDDPEALAEYIRLEQHTFIDLLALYFDSGDPSYRDIYVGIKLLQFYWSGFASVEERRRFTSEVLAADERALIGYLADKVPPEELGRLGEFLAGVGRALLYTGTKSLDILMIGDCLFIDIMCFLTGRAQADDITLNPTYVASRNPVELRQELRAKADRKYDLVFYSPVSFNFSLPFSATSSPWNGLQAAGEVRAMADSEYAEVERTLDLMTSLFECPIFVHNTANVRRHDSTLRGRLEAAATWRTRRIARRHFNGKLAAYVERRNAQTYRHLHLVDEEALLGSSSDQELARLKFHHNAHHATVMGEKLAAIYGDLIHIHAHLLTRKLVVCDLDNTIWEGEIGEGEVRHHADRQRTLKALRRKGVVLSVNSKNDPKNVHWRGCGLNEDDFVSMQINWDTKLANMRRIQDDLNLKYKDYIFIDDRADQRQMIADGLPEIRVMDATSDRTWELLRLWAELLDDQAETDRTLLYRQRDLRDSFVAQAEAEAVDDDPTGLYAKLDIRVAIREARSADLKRVAELINRTNQFNLCGSRVTFRQVADWHADPHTHILVGDGADKFGPMGQVCILVVEAGAAEARIPAFVLSCRVFGYGIETALLNAVKRRLGGQPDRPIVGLYQETPSNEPCRRVYPDNGFAWDGAAWVYRGSDEPVDPAWLSVVDEWRAPVASR